MALITRHLTEHVRDLSTKTPVISITGPRQSGKTTLSRQVFPDYDYVDLDRPQTRRAAIDNPEGFLNQFKKGVIIDEAQNAPELFSLIKVRVDESRRNGEFILTGSQHFLFMEKITQSLAGRTAIFHLLPFSVSELEGTEHALSSPFDYIFKGFYPRVYSEGFPPVSFYPSYLQTYVERDVRQVQNVSDLYTFERFMHLLAGHTGQMFNQTNISNDLGVSTTTVSRWMSLLQSSFVAFLLPPYFKNFNKRVVKTPKVYFYDTGLACSLLGIENARQLDTHFARGALFENFIIVETMKRFLNRGILKPNLFFWRDSSGHEIDLLVERGGRLFPCEIKSGETVNDSFFKNLNVFNDIADNPASQSYLIYGGNENQNRSKAQVRTWNNLPDFE